MVNIEQKFLWVVPIKDAVKYLTKQEIESVDAILTKISVGRRRDGKKINSYWVCNHDEPYAGKVGLTILCGERDKLSAPPPEKEASDA